MPIISNRALQWEELETSPTCKSYTLGNISEHLLHIISSGFVGMYIVIEEDAYNMLYAEHVNKEQIKLKYNIDINF